MYKSSDLTILKELYEVLASSLLATQENGLIFNKDKNQWNPMVFNLDSVHNNHKFKELEIIKKPITNYYYLYLLGCAGIAYLVYRMFKQKKTISKHNEFPTNEVIEKTLTYKGKTLSQEELDKLLDIDSIQSSDNRKSKRKTIIDQINEIYKTNHGQELIIREKDIQDKRRFLYRILG